MSVRPLVLASGSAGWREVPCTILSSRLKTHSDTGQDGGPTYSVEIRYRYKIYGSTYESGRYAFSGGSTNIGVNGMLQAVAAYPVGATRKCLVDPDAPAEAVLTRDLPATVWIGLPFGGVFVLIGVGGLWFVWAGGRAFGELSLGGRGGRRGRRGRTQSNAVGASGGAGVVGGAGGANDANPRGDGGASGEAGDAGEAGELIDAGGSGAGNRSRGFGGGFSSTAVDQPHADAGPDGPDGWLVPRFVSWPVLALYVGVTLFWNGIVSVFVMIWIIEWRQGNFIWFLAIFLIPFECFGLFFVGLCVVTLRRLRSPKPQARLLAPPRPGAAVELEWAFSRGTGGLRRLTIELVGQGLKPVESNELTSRRMRALNARKRDIFHQDPVATLDTPQQMAGGRATVQLPATPAWAAHPPKNAMWLIRLTGRGLLPPATRWDFEIVPEDETGDA